MKKFFALLLSLCMLAGMVPAVFAAEAETAEEQPVFRMGIMGDHQLAGTTGANMEATISAMHYFADHGVDAVIDVGDIADSNPETVYSYFVQQYNSIIGEDVPLVAVPGNHDIWSDNTLNVYRQYFGEPNKHLVIGGYHFIVISANPALGTATNGNYGIGEKTFARTELNAAKADTPEGQPIFVVTHQHVKNTVYASGPDANWCNDFLCGIIEDYPNAVHFSGHSHAVLEDERSIWQGDFTAVGTSSLAYTELEYGKANGSVPPEADQAKQYLYLEIYSDRIEITRVKAATGKQIKDKWVLDLPLQKSTFRYTDARADSRTAPYFAPNAAVEASMSGSNITVTFDAAHHDDFVHSYGLKLYKNESAGPVSDILIFSDFYKGLENMSKTVSWTFQNVAEEYALYRLEITPIESFGKRGEPLVYEFASVKQKQIPAFTRGKLFTVDFASGEARNAVSALEVKRTGGSVGKVNDKFAFIPGENSKLTVTMSNTYYMLVRNKLTLEAVFTVNRFGAEQTLISCYNNGGVKLWLNEDGKLCATVNKSDKTDLDIVSETAVPLGAVCNAAATYNGSAFTLWLDGEAVASEALTGNINYNRNAKFGIGSDPDGENRLDGVIFTASLESKALDADAIKAFNDDLMNGYDIRVLLPALEQLNRVDMLRQANTGNVVLNKILDYYEAEMTAITDSAYVTPAIVSGAIAYRDLNEDVRSTGATNLPAFDSPVIDGVEHQKQYEAGEAPEPTFTNAESITLDGEPYAEGTPIGNGKHMLIAFNGWRMAGVQFTVGKAVMPVIYGVEDGRVYDLTNEDAPAITWEPAELQARLDNQPYAAGTPVTADGWHVFMLPCDGATLVYAFKIEHSVPPVRGDLDGDGEVTVSDALRALRMAAKLAEADEAADVDGDGSVTVADALAILRVAVGLEETL
ncbi:MAG: metallophosphoesterase [Clostridia bacterium]|nr:metallophosphoesterase [Clostridia bacterium]